MEAESNLNQNATLSAERKKLVEESTVATERMETNLIASFEEEGDQMVMEVGAAELSTSFPNSEEEGSSSETYVEPLEQVQMVQANVSALPRDTTLRHVIM